VCFVVLVEWDEVECWVDFVVDDFEVELVVFGDCLLIGEVGAVEWVDVDVHVG